jgi:HEAT repeat protein/cyclophilin family peptidyl-prolyl cis-trans isomerase
MAHSEFSIAQRVVGVAFALYVSGCASAPPAPVVVKPVGPSFEEKMALILRLEDHRVLHDPAPPAPPEPPPPPVAPRGRKAAAATTAPPPPPPPPDLVTLTSDSESRVRHRAALAIGRVGLSDGIDPLLPLLASDPEPEVRQIAAFALGLIGDGRAKDPLIAALADPSPLVRGSAAEALGLIGDPSAADAIGKLVTETVRSGVLAQPPGDEDDARRDTATAACRLGLFALVRLKSYDTLAAAVLDPNGQPLVRWWPVAYALQRLEDKRALPALLTFAKDANPYARAFAAKGLGALKDRAALPVLAPLLTSGDRGVLIEAIRALGRIGDVSAAAPLQKLLREAGVPAVKPAATGPAGVKSEPVDPIVRLEALSALGGLHATADAAEQVPQSVIDDVLDLLTDPNPSIRAAALRSTAALDAENLRVVLSGMDPDPHWSVRVALATLLGTLPPEVAAPRLTALLADQDERVLPSVLAAITKLKLPNAATILIGKLNADDPAVRAAAADDLSELKAANAAPALVQAYEFGLRDATYIARAAALAALATYGPAEAETTLKTALGDKDWAVRVRAAMLLKDLDPTATPASEIRPAPTTVPAELYAEPRLTAPPVSTMVYIDTDRGTIQVELAVIDAPLTVENFVSLARKGYFNGLSIHRVVPNFVIQDGDPRGDGEGGPGYSIRDELNERPYLRGTVGMALDPWRDTGGSQFFITLSPQPHLDAKYTAFGRVVSGMEVVDKIQQWDVIRRVRVWDGERMTER